VHPSSPRARRWKYSVGTHRQHTRSSCPRCHPQSPHVYRYCLEHVSLSLINGIFPGPCHQNVQLKLLDENQWKDYMDQPGEERVGTVLCVASRPALPRPSLVPPTLARFLLLPTPCRSCRHLCLWLARHVEQSVVSVMSMVPAVLPPSTRDTLGNLGIGASI
jgi:hypothetical protein